jgi:Ser/Thr protein kinase RdoA (MazF antagonist)
MSGAEISPLPGNENENYLVKTTRRSFVVKKLRGHSAANTELEAIYRERLADNGMPVNRYILFSGDSHVVTINGDNYVATDFNEGSMAIRPKAVAEVGKLLAKIHSLDVTGLPSRQSWYRKSYISDSLNIIDDRYTEARREFAARFKNVPDFWNSGLPKGIIHGDLHCDNIIVSDKYKIVSIIDWEEAAIEPLLLDIAHTAQQMSFVNGVCDAGLFVAFMDEYQSVRPLQTQEKKLFEPALRYTMLVLSVWAYVKASQGQMNGDLFQRVGNYYKASYTLPQVI